MTNDERYRWLLEKYSTCKAGTETTPGTVLLHFEYSYPMSNGTRPSLDQAVDDDMEQHNDRN